MTDLLLLWTLSTCLLPFSPHEHTHWFQKDSLTATIWSHHIFNNSQLCRVHSRVLDLQPVLSGLVSSSFLLNRTQIQQGVYWSFSTASMPLPTHAKLDIFPYPSYLRKSDRHCPGYHRFTIIRLHLPLPRQCLMWWKVQPYSLLSQRCLAQSRFASFFSIRLPGLLCPLCLLLSSDLTLMLCCSLS